ncbi:MAG: EI24 domain-containing protein [Burkholderiales bacterium]|nr:EI24 domain-containing protein [Burkholderiales bacterium]
MRGVLDSFWRAVAYCMLPRVLLLSLLPLLVAGGATLALGWLYWESAVALVRTTIEQLSVVTALLQWLDSIGMQALHALIAPLVVVALSVPVVVLATLLLVALAMTPAIVELVAARRFPDLERRHGGGWLQSLFWSLVSTLAAIVALVLSVPLWFIPPLVFVLPPMIWGWLTYRIFAFDVLAAHASANERRRVLRENRWPLFAIGIACGLLGAAPSLIWALGAATLIMAPLLAVASVWLYTAVFTFAACWFAHFALAALAAIRAAEAVAPAPAPAAVLEALRTDPPLLPPAP